MTSRPTSLSDAGVQLSSENRTSSQILNSHDVPPLISSLTECDDQTRAKSKMEKYFAEKPDKNIFMKLIHPSYHERNLQFKKIFVDKGLIDENDQFLASYSCAYQREILAQGRMFISQWNVCFYANIIGWETTLVIPMREIKMIKKMKAAFIFPNSIQINTSEKYFFASFINRDKSFQVLTTAHEKVAGEEGKAMTREEVWDMVYNADEKNSSQNHTPPDGSTPASTKNASTENMTVSSNRSSLNGSISRPASTKTSKSSKTIDKDSTSQSSSSTTSDFHEEEVDVDVEVDDNLDTEATCPCTEHSGRLLLDREFKVSVEKFFELVFTETPFMTEFNSRYFVGDYAAATWVRDHRGENSRTCTYTVSLSHAMAPKAIIVNEKQVLTRFPNPRQGFVLTKETQNSGVPYAEHFTVNCKYCISRTGPSSCRVKVHGGIVYKKTVWSMIRGFIEKGTYGGLVDHYALLNTMMDEYLQKYPDGGSIPPPNTIPALEAAPRAEELSQSQLRRRGSSRKSNPSRHAAGGESVSQSAASMSTAAKDHLIAETYPPGVMTAVSSVTPTTTNTSSSGDIKPLLLVIIAILALHLILQIYSIMGTGVEVHTNTHKEENLGEMLTMLMEQIKELKQQVNSIQKNH